MTGANLNIDRALRCAFFLGISAGVEVRRFKSYRERLAKHAGVRSWENIPQDVQQRLRERFDEGVEQAARGLR